MQKLQPSAANLADLRDNLIPDLEKQIADESAALDREQEEVEEAKLKVQRAKLAVRDLQTLKGAAALVTRTLGEVKDLKADIQRLERDLESSGSLKTVEEVQADVDRITNEMLVSKSHCHVTDSLAKPFKGNKTLWCLTRSSSKMPCEHIRMILVGRHSTSDSSKVNRRSVKEKKQHYGNFKIRLLSCSPNSRSVVHSNCPQDNHLTP